MSGFRTRISRNVGQMKAAGWREKVWLIRIDVVAVAVRGEAKILGFDIAFAPFLG